jgi:hypothetical protein
LTQFRTEIPDPISCASVVTTSYRSTQHARRFLACECGSAFRLVRPFMAWLKDGTEKTMGDAADDGLAVRLKSGKRN